MGYGICLLVWGEYACFTRPEMKVERVSYDVMTPSAARGILEAVHWKPSIKWVVDKIHVLNEIKFDNVRRNEVGSKISVGNVKKALKGKTVELCMYASENQNRQQRAALLLRDVSYVIEAHFEMSGESENEDAREKHYAMFSRRARQGQCFKQPYLGCREFPAMFRLIESDEILPQSIYGGEGEKDLGWMLLDINYESGMNPVFFRATMKDGVIEIPSMENGVAG